MQQSTQKIQLLQQEQEFVKQNPGMTLKDMEGLREGDEDAETKGWTSWPLPLLDGGVQQLEDGVCFHEGQTLDLLIKE